jgi:outer membrane protein TolC
MKRRLVTARYPVGCGLLFFGVQQITALTLDQFLNTTLDKNPAILQAKANLEQAAGHRLELRSLSWPNVKVAVPAGVQGGHRAGESSTQPFAFARGVFLQPLFNAAIPPARRLGDVDVLIAEQKLNIAVTEQLHAARVGFYTAIYNRKLQSVREEQRRRFEGNAASQKDRYAAGLSDRGAFTSATLQATAVNSQIEAARRAYGDARVKMLALMGGDMVSGESLPEPEGDLPFAPVMLDVNRETAAALERRTDIKLARLVVRAANEQQRIIEAEYYPVVTGSIIGDYIPASSVSGVHREGSTRRTDDILGSEVREGAVYTWRVIDNGRVIGAAMKQNRVREINELTCRKLEANVGNELSRIRNELTAIAEHRQSLADGLEQAEQASTIVQQNLASGITSELEYRLAENSFLDVKSGLLTVTYQHNLALAEWDRATGRYFQLSDDSANAPR